MIRRVSVLVALVVLGLIGCGGMAIPEGIVTLDGTPVEGAQVTFVSSGQGDSAPVGFTNASGKFKLSTLGKPGAKPGDYKVLVTKSKTGPSEPMKPGTADYMKMMEGKAKESKQPGGIGPAPVGGGKGAAIDTTLPEIYATAATTPLTAKIPSSGPIELKLTSKK